MALTVNACAYCGRPAQGNYAIHRDGVLNGNEGNPQVPLCDDCGGSAEPSAADIWLKISLRDDNGERWPVVVWPCGGDDV